MEYDLAYCRGARLDDLYGPFQPKLLYDSVYMYKGQVSEDIEQPVSVNQQITSQLSQSLSGKAEQKAMPGMLKIQPSTTDCLSRKEL